LVRWTALVSALARLNDELLALPLVCWPSVSVSLDVERDAPLDDLWSEDDTDDSSIMVAVRFVSFAYRTEL